MIELEIGICKEVFEINVKELISKYPNEKKSFYYNVSIEKMDLEEGSDEEIMLSKYFDEEIDNWLVNK